MDGAAQAARKMDDGIGCPFRSFSPDTLVATSLGLIPIDQVAPGTEVWAADEETGERSLRKVSSTAFHLAEDGLLLTVGGETLQTTAQHPFFTAGGEWVEAGRLQIGQEVRSLGGELLRVEKLEKREGRFAVFNFEVDEDHSYFVGEGGLLAHNCGSGTRRSPVLSGDAAGSDLRYLGKPGRFEFQGMEVRGVRDISHIPESTLRVMAERGFAASDASGRGLQGHHFRQRAAGPIVEVPAQFHKTRNPSQHPFGNRRGMGLTPDQREVFESTWRPAYWKARARDALLRKGVL